MKIIKSKTKSNKNAVKVYKTNLHNNFLNCCPCLEKHL